MSVWKPATFSEVEALLEQAVKALHPRHLERFSALRVAFRSVPVGSHPGESVVVVGEHGGRMIYWSDVEKGWALAAPGADGGIPERDANQHDLRHILGQLFGDPEAGR